jgi:hypothetical protein
MGYWPKEYSRCGAVTPWCEYHFYDVSQSLIHHKVKTARKPLCPDRRLAKINWRTRLYSEQTRRLLFL